MKLIKLGNNETLIKVNQENIELLFSYNTCVGGRDEYGFFKSSTWHSRTTTKHINKYLNGENARLMSQSTLDKLGILNVDHKYHTYYPNKKVWQNIREIQKSKKGELV